MTDEVFNETYFMDGIRAGVSNYENYVYLPNKTIPMIQSIVRYLNIERHSLVLDFGCSRGYVVRAFREMGFKAWGVDTSQWAIENCDPMVRDYVSNQLGFSYPWPSAFSHIFAKDVLEHIPSDQLGDTIKSLLRVCFETTFIVVPLSAIDGLDYICPRDNSDQTHVTRWTLPTWLDYLRGLSREWVANGAYHIPGIKQASEPFHRSCGFFTMRRLLN
jgi:hypothetical protein